MTPAEFAARMVGVPWRRWRSDWEAVDCWGLVALYFRAVLGIDIEVARGIAGRHGFDEWPNWESDWRECDPQGGATCFMAWRGGAPTHCGILLDAQRVLHSEGSDDHPGSVRVSRLSTVARIYGALKFYRYEPCSSS